jgi:ubiquitin C-terminal hydrolase
VQECGHQCKRFQAELGLSIQVTATVETLEGGLHSYFTSERMDGANQWACPKCKRLVDAANSWWLETAPNTLIVSLKRFDPHTLSKVTRAIPFPVHLSLAEYLVRSLSLL